MFELDRVVADNSNQVIKKVESKVGRFSYSKYLSQSLFLINEELSLLDKNEQGQAAIEMHWLGVLSNKIHFSNRETDKVVKTAIAKLASSDLSTIDFVVRCNDSIFRACTLIHQPSSYGPNNRKEYVLAMKSDLVDKVEKINTLTQAFSLSKSESGILKLMIDGLKPKEIAYEKGISLSTVRSHLRTLYAKMNVRNYNDCLILAVRLVS